MRRLDLLDLPLTAHLASVDHRGAPWSVPVWYDWDGATLWVSTLPERDWVVNVAREPRVALSVCHPADPVGQHLALRGVAQLAGEDDGLADRVALRYLGSTPHPWTGPRVRVSVTPWP